MITLPANLPDESQVPPATAEDWKSFAYDLERFSRLNSERRFVRISVSLAREVRRLEIVHRELLSMSAGLLDTAKSWQKKAEQLEAELAKPPFDPLYAYREIQESRCEKFPGGEQCALRAGHTGHCKWERGD